VVQRKLQIATDFYGLNLNTISAEAGGAAERAAAAKSTVAVAVDAAALASLDSGALLRATGRSDRKNVPVLILGVTPDTDSAALQRWTGGAVVRCIRGSIKADSRYVVGRLEGFTRQLTGAEFPSAEHSPSYFELDGAHDVTSLATIRESGRHLPTFVRVSLPTGPLFLACGAPEGASVDGANTFPPIAPVMMFIRNSAGEFGWHTVYRYANLTIDDPWLRERYGNLDYRQLLAEMEKHNFHTTVAFIPWNFDRSEAGVASLFRAHPKRFSVAIHGDNHDHKEFTDYRSKPLPVQIAAIKQSLARMEKFQQLTQIPYDRIMIFPHSIAPQKTLEALKAYNFLGTVNSSNIPMDEAAASGDRAESLRAFTVSFGDFPSLGRQSVTPAPTEDFIAANAFLGNPLLFYGHQDFFSQGIAAFDAIADSVNRADPDIRWQSLGETIKHLYLVKARDDNGYDVVSFTSNAHLDNLSRREATFYFSKKEAGDSAIASVTVDGRPHPFQVRDGLLDLSVTIPAGEGRNVVIDYKNDLNLGSVEIGKTSARVYALRTLSDFRDIVLARVAAGRGFVAFYYLVHDAPGRTYFYSSLAMLCVIGLTWRFRGTRGSIRGRRNAAAAKEARS
jgi:hypothetical protein